MQLTRSNPEFRESLRLLYEEEKYSQTDIALMIGVSKERVRQHIVFYGFKREEVRQRGLHARRIWNDELNRFIPIGAYKSFVNKLAVKATKESRIQKRLQFKANIIQRLKQLKQILNRDPTVREMSEFLYNTTDKSWHGFPFRIMFSYYSPKERREGKRLELYHSILREAGISPRRTGTVIKKQSNRRFLKSKSN